MATRKTKTARTSTPLPTIGWREWVHLPDLRGVWTKAKVDTGARTSSLHAFDIEEFERDGRGWVRFEVHPLQRSTASAVICEAPLAEHRAVRSSNGSKEFRPVVLTTVKLGDHSFTCEFTLAGRDEMGFRMLLGRTAARHRFLVDPGNSYLTGRRPKPLPPYTEQPPGYTF